METNNNTKNLIIRSKEMLINQYRHPETRDWHWDLMQDWLVDEEGNLTERGKEIAAEVDAWLAEHDSGEEKDQDGEAE